ncbi:site-specific integrase [Pseudomonas asiatica]|uniref:site-specific integrase n=1 Tax=Pseudomonas asiatica TaxID=2219225 RepID=UPI0025A3BE33|nr:site-specific integrase [Pseudomonas asiatica]WJN48573.1 site-specific integrase [Pseudomonas asiatica]
MINTTDSITLHGDDVLQSAQAILQELAQKAMDAETVSGKANPELLKDKQARHRLAVSIFLRHRKGRALTYPELSTLYDLCLVPDKQLDVGLPLYTELTGECTPELKDVSGVRIPIRAMFVLLWAQGKITLPHNFNLSGVWAKYPDLIGRSQGFIHQICGPNDSHQQRCARNFQYRVNWKKPDDVVFEELWEAAPAVVDKQREIKSTATKGSKGMDFSYLAWLHLFAIQHPSIVSPDQARLLEGYHKHLLPSRVDVSSAEIKKSYADFAQHWGSIDPSHSKSENLKSRRARYAAGLDGRKRRNQQKFEERLAIKEASNWDAQSVLSPEQYAILPGRKRPSKGGYKWVNGYYNTPENPYIEDKLAAWVKAGNLHLDHIENMEDLSTATRRQEIGYVHILMDYLGRYLPAWLSKHPDCGFEFPTNIEDFHRSIFWHRTKKNDKYTNSNDKSEIDLPLTLMQFYDLKRSIKTKAKFIFSMWRYFEIAIASGNETLPDGRALVSGPYKNPIHPGLDSPGSGPAGKSDKIPLPIGSMMMVEAYMLALDAVGVELQNKCLEGLLSFEDSLALKDSVWIDLEKYGISYSIKIWNPDDISETLEVPLKKIINAYSWKNAKYKSSDHEIYVPWLSQMRMLTVALFSGLRLQNCQWLDIRSFDKYFDNSLRDSLSSCTLYVNTDKSGNSRPVTLPYKVMDVLLKERHFQKKDYGKKYTGVYYENDASNAEKYGKIHPLFRSPWHDDGAPFSNASYTLKWTLILRGFQDIYNNFVAPENRHDFVEQAADGGWSAVHTPHALRATWITHRRIYAFLDYSIIGGQVGHAQPYTSAHYVVPTRQETLAIVESANKAVSAQAFAALTGRPPSPSSPESALVKGWQQHREDTVREQHLISVIPGILDIEETGLDLIASTKTQRVKFLDNCICALDGDCPKKLMNFTRKARTCGICPYAIFGIDHLPGLNAKIRDLANRADHLKPRLQQLRKHQPHSPSTEIAYEELSLSSVELAGYRQVVQILEKNWREEKFPKGYITRHRDLANAVRHSVDMGDPKQRVLSMVLDMSQYPALASEHYPLILQEMARNPELLKVVNQPVDDRELYIGQVLSIMQGAGLSFEDIAAYCLSNPTALSLQDQASITMVLTEMAKRTREAVPNLP